MTPKAIKLLLSDLLRRDRTAQQIGTTLEARGATYDDLVAYIVAKERGDDL